MSSQVSGSEELPEDDRCRVCGRPDSVDGDCILFCDKCDMAVHQRCYGVVSIPDGDWYCAVCEWRLREHRPAARWPTCVLCGRNDALAMHKCVDGKSWCHIVCAFWVPGVSGAPRLASRGGRVAHASLRARRSTLCIPSACAPSIRQKRRCRATTARAWSAGRRRCVGRGRARARGG